MSKYLVFTILISILTVLSCTLDNHKKIIVQDPDGYFKEEFIVVNDSIKDGTYIKYYNNGKIWDSCFYKMDTLDGIRKIFSEKGNVEILETYKNGILDGPYLIYYPNGQIKFKQIFINNIMQGDSYGYYDDGSLKEEVLIVDGLENGPFKEYYKSGKVHWKGTYLEGDNENDTLYEYDLNGELATKLFCRKGVCQTVWLKDRGYVKPDTSIKIHMSQINKTLE